MDRYERRGNKGDRGGREAQGRRDMFLPVKVSTRRVRESERETERGQRARKILEYALGGSCHSHTLCFSLSVSLSLRVFSFYRFFLTDVTNGPDKI